MNRFCLRASTSDARNCNSRFVANQTKPDYNELRPPSMFACRQTSPPPNAVVVVTALEKRLRERRAAVSRVGVPSSNAPDCLVGPLLLSSSSASLHGRYATVTHAAHAVFMLMLMQAILRGLRRRCREKPNRLPVAFSLESNLIVAHPPASDP